MSSDNSVGIEACYGKDGLGIESSYTVGTGSVSWEVKLPGRGVNHPPPSSTEVKEKVEVYHYFSSGTSWLVLWQTSPFTLPLMEQGRLYLSAFRVSPGRHIVRQVQ